MNPLELHNQETENDDRPWVQIAETVGAEQTRLIVGYLREHEIQAVAIESRALGMITGANAIARVMVPEEEVGPALNLLEPNDEPEDDWDWTSGDDSSISDIEKAVLGATAIAFSPLGAGIAYVLSQTVGTEEHSLAENEVDCPNCDVGLKLSDDELEQGWYLCPDCDQVISLDEFVTCPSCNTELQLDPEEQVQGWFICPECHRAVRTGR